MTREVRTWCHSGAAPRSYPRRGGDQIDHPPAVAAEGFEVLPHLVVAPRRVGERPPDVGSDVVIAEADGVGVSVGSLTDLGLRPLPYSG